MWSHGWQSILLVEKEKLTLFGTLRVNKAEVPKYFGSESPHGIFFTICVLNT